MFEKSKGFVVVAEEARLQVLIPQWSGHEEL